jgi:hypothetical protein
LIVSTVHGLPVHVLLVHAVVILVPLSAVLLVLTSVWPAARRRFAGPNALLALSLLALIPLTTSAGEWLEGRVDDNPLVQHHAELGDTALLFTAPIVVLAILVWWRSREETAAMGELPPPPSGPAGLSHLLTHERPLLAPASRAVAAGIAALCVLAAGAATYDIYRIGDSGAKAAWHDGFNAQN